MATIIRIVTIAVFLAVLPALASAAAPATFKEAAELFLQLLQMVFVLLFSLLGVGMAWGVVLYFINADSDSKRTEIRGYLLWGIIGITVVFSLWAILTLLSSTFGWGTAGIPYISPPSR